MGARGEAQGIRWYGCLHGQKFRTGKIPHLPLKNEGKIPHQVEIRNFPRGKIPPRNFPPPLYWSLSLYGHRTAASYHGMNTRQQHLTTLWAAASEGYCEAWMVSVTALHQHQL